jgi:hypothetical protein
MHYHWDKLEMAVAPQPNKVGAVDASQVNVDLLQINYMCGMALALE